MARSALFGCDARGDDGDVVTVVEQAGLAHLHRLVGREESGHLPSEQPHIHRAFYVFDGVEHRLDLGGVTGFHHRHVGGSPHDGDVLDGLVGHTARGGDAGQEADEADFEVGIGDRHG